MFLPPALCVGLQSTVGPVSLRSSWLCAQQKISFLVLRHLSWLCAQQKRMSFPALRLSTWRHVQQKVSFLPSLLSTWLCAHQKFSFLTLAPSSGAILRTDSCVPRRHLSDSADNLCL